MAAVLELAGRSPKRLSATDRFKFAHDYAGNRTMRDVDVAIYASNNQVHVYAG